MENTKPPRDERQEDERHDRGQQDNRTQQETHRKFVISGPGAADFIAAPGGVDMPGVSPDKGTSELRGDTPLTDPKNIVPAPAPEVDPPPHERTIYVRANERDKKQQDRDEKDNE